MHGANPVTIQLLEGAWSKDEQHVYHGHQLVKADAASFRFIGNNWAVDNANAYQALAWVSLGHDNDGWLKVNIFADIDQETFEVIDAFKAKDKGNVYDAISSPDKRAN